MSKKMSNTHAKEYTWFFCGKRLLVHNYLLVEHSIMIKTSLERSFRVNKIVLRSSCMGNL